MARALSKESLLSDGAFVKSASFLYGTDLDAVAERYSSLTENLSGEIRFFSASGRAELIGNHTDHNHGFVIASAVDMDTAAAVVKTSEPYIVVHSVGYPAFIVNLDDEEIVPEQYGTSDALLKGVLKGFRDRGRKVGGFIAHTHSNIFKGAGVSSSAAFELLLCKILNSLYNNDRIDYKEMAIISQYAENVYFGKPSGLMDQLTVAHGGVSFMDFNDPSYPDAKSLEWEFDDVGLIIINCGGDHCNLTDEYAAIRQNMHDIASYFNEKVLRDVDESEFYGALSELKEQFDGRAILRAMHYFEENKRVHEAYAALERKDKEEFLKLVTESGISSYDLLQNCYPKGDTAQPIPLALNIAKRYKHTLAYRVHGGGFAGTILIMTDKHNSDQYVSYASKLFGQENVFAVSVRNAGASELFFGAEEA